MLVAAFCVCVGVLCVLVRGESAEELRFLAYTPMPSSVHQGWLARYSLVWYVAGAGCDGKAAYVMANTGLVIADGEASTTITLTHSRVTLAPG